jgi:hypothetical protein
VRALLDLMRENEAAVQDDLVPCEFLLQQVSENLKILGPELGDQDLVISVAAELAKVTALISRSSQRQ